MSQNNRPKAPSITSLRVAQLGAHFLHLKWDNVGSNFYYVVDYSPVQSDGSVSWINLGTSHTNEWFESRVLSPNTKYKFRISVTYGTFEQSDWVESDLIETFPTNAYSVMTMNNFIVNRTFVEQKLINNKPYIDFDTDVINATLMDENYVYDQGVSNISYVEDHMAYDREYHEVQGEIEKVCADVNRTYLGYNKGVLYLFERWQNMAKASNDGGQTWWYYQALNDRVGYPIARNVMSQNKNTTFVLGYDELFYGRDSDEVRFSSNVHWWSDDNLTFVRMDVDSDIPFPTMVFGRYTKYPDDIRRKVEAQSCSDRWVYAVGEDRLRRILTRNAPVGTDESGNTVKLWDPTSYRITGDDLSVVKKVEYFDKHLYALVTGKVETMNTDRRTPDNVIDSEHKGIYRFDEFYIPEEFHLGNLTIADGEANYDAGIDINRRIMTFLPNGTHVNQVGDNWEQRVFRGRTHGTLVRVSSRVSPRNKDSFYFSADVLDANGNLDNAKVQKLRDDFAYPAIFELYMEDGELVEPQIPNGGQWVRVYGNTKKERDQINHRYSNMSTDGTRLFVSSPEYTYQGTIPDTELPNKYDEVGVAVKYDTDYPYTTTKRPYFYLLTMETNETTFSPKPHRYYAEAEMNWMSTRGERCMVNNDNHAVIVVPKNVHTYQLDPDKDGINREVWDKGTVTFYLDNVAFTGFTQYCNGIMIHRPYNRDKDTGGEIIGYYEFPHRVRDEASIIWRPNKVMASATLQEQVKDVVYEPEEQTGLVDPHLAPLIYKMGPEAYFNDTNFSKFAEYYLRFLSEGTNSSYNMLLNLIRNKYPREENAYEYLWSEIRRRNLYIDEAKRDEVVRFFESKASNFYSSKGTIDSYKFLFKLLYNEDVEIEVESEVGVDYDIIVSSTNITQDLVGRTIYTKTGRANVTYIERMYDSGKLLWKMTIHNLMGKLEVGQEIKSETNAFKGMVTRGVAGKELAYSDIDYINRPRSYYVMKIRSSLNTARYRDDVIRFVHPVGFGFIGITVMTVFINGGISMDHLQTIVDVHKAFRWDAGLPSVNLRLTTDVDPDSDVFDPDPWYDDKYGFLKETEHNTTPFDISEWENAINTETGQKFEPRNYDTDEEDIVWNGVTYKPSERRSEWSPLFSHFTSRFTDLRNLTWLRMKDDIGDPRDPKHMSPAVDPTQYNIKE